MHKGNSHNTFVKNVEYLMSEGFEIEQAEAIAFEKLQSAKRKARKGALREYKEPD